MSEHQASVGVVILTQGQRPHELARALQSVDAQKGVDVDIVVIGNGWQPQGLPERVHTVYLPENRGVGARNAGVDHVSGDILFFLDDDAWFNDSETLKKVTDVFHHHPQIGMIQTRLDDPEATTTPRYWIPRLRKGDALHSSTCMYVMEAASAIRRSIFDHIGGWAQDFGYAHEGIELTWQVWNAGYEVWYIGDIVTCHPAIFPTRHADYYWHNARNRVWLARRNLPAPLGVVYANTWRFVDWRRLRHDPDDWQAWQEGWKQGWRSPPGHQRRLSWSTILRMAKHGRPPVV